MTKRDLFGFWVEIDEENTRRWYAAAEAWDCNCGYCRNFLALARERKLPPVVLQKLDQLNIPPEKATYVCHIYSDGSGEHYEFSYRIAGNILGGKRIKGIAGWCDHELYPYGAPGFPEPHFDLEFEIALPWVLDEQRD